MFGVLSTFLRTILKANVCLGDTDAGRGVSGERGGGSGGISDLVRVLLGGFPTTGADAGAFGGCGEIRLGDNRPGEGSGVTDGIIRGGRLAHGEPREPRLSFNVIGGGGDGGGSSTDAATTTTVVLGWSAFCTVILGSVASEVIDLLK